MEKKLTWWRLMMKNPGYLIAFALAIVFLIGLIVKRDETPSAAWWFGISIPIAVMIIIAYGAFYKFWFKDLNKGKDIK